MTVLGWLLEAREAFRGDDQPRGFRILRAYLDELSETDNVVAASVAGIEFINMLGPIGRFTEGSRIPRYLDVSNAFGALAAQTVVAEAAAAIAATGHSPDPRPMPDLDDRQALEYMRTVLDELT